MLLLYLINSESAVTSEPRPRIETFATTSVLNRNGVKPLGEVIGPDDRGLWWPTLPPRPSIDEVEQRKRPQEEAHQFKIQNSKLILHVVSWSLN